MSIKMDKPFKSECESQEMDFGRRSEIVHISKYTRAKMGFDFKKLRWQQNIAYDKKQIQLAYKEVSE